MRVGVIGSGAIGETKSRLLASVGYEVMISSHHTEKLSSLVAKVISNTRASYHCRDKESGKAVFCCL